MHAPHTCMAHPLPVAALTGICLVRTILTLFRRVSRMLTIAPCRELISDRFPIASFNIEIPRSRYYEVACATDPRLFHSEWMQQLTFLMPDLLRRIRVHTGGETVQDLLFRIGDLSRVPLPNPNVSGRGILPELEPTPQLLREAHEHTSRITDPVLRERFTKVIAKALVSVPSTPATDR